MHFDRVAAFARNRPDLPAGVVAILFCERRMEVAVSARRLEAQGAVAIVAIGVNVELDDITIPVHHIAERPTRRNAWKQLNTLIAVLEVASAQVDRSLNGPNADIDRLGKIRTNLTSTLEVRIEQEATWAEIADRDCAAALAS